MEAIRMENLVKTYGSGSTAVHALKNVSLYVNPGEVVGLLGPSGSGKTTLLQCLGAVIDPTSGRIALNGETVFDNGWKINDLRALRRDKIGFVFQAAYLIPFLSVLDNVALLPMLAGKPNEEARKRAKELLSVLEVDHRSHAKPAELSGGEQQRVAIARALALDPKVLLFDEPTSALDPELVGEVLDVIKGLTQLGVTLVIVTHEIGFAREVADHVVFLCDGQLIEEGPPEQIFRQPRHPRTVAFLGKVL